MQNNYYVITKHQYRGFTLPVVLMLSLAALITAAALMNGITSSYNDSIDRHYQRLAEFAGESGIAYASSCLEKSYRTLTWGSGNTSNPGAPLTQSTDCTGATNASLPEYLLPATAADSVRTYFTVGEPEVLTTNSARLKATGKLEVISRIDGSVVKTYTAVVKETSTWALDLRPQRTSSGTGRTCAIQSFNVYCWGRNSLGQLGDDIIIILHD